MPTNVETLTSILMIAIIVILILIAVLTIIYFASRRKIGIKPKNLHIYEVIKGGKK